MGSPRHRRSATRVPRRGGRGADGVRGGDESDVDCGGSCGKCGTGGACKAGADCQSGFCTNGKCDPPSCMDGVKNGHETGLDCGGGLCPGCPDGTPCMTAADC